MSASFDASCVLFPVGLKFDPSTGMNTTDCRRAQVLNYFGELFDPQLCGGACDICAAGPQGQAADVTEYAKKAVQLVKNLTEPVKAKVTLVYCVDVFRGSRAKKVRPLPRWSLCTQGMMHTDA